ncbi:hypothetical protein PV05_06611 [Exophiala xenobiotica]|uniref:Uncharacterized protein n=1 Tax=Exophiala xenobiotica TaxID=348802 RepID=A0A0D2BNT7_9EURO|nr:uncharacterized protein PV05_06611 [Exophiala xenobiotica]KIW54241.1 hypothetical protein PV05_06611 [Exophiala xenobiotica]
MTSPTKTARRGHKRKAKDNHKAGPFNRRPMSSEAGTTSSAAQGASTQALAELAQTYEEAKAELATANKTWKAAKKARRNAKKALKKAQDALEKADRVSHKERLTTSANVSTMSSATDASNTSSPSSSDSDGHGDSSRGKMPESIPKIKTASQLSGAEGKTAIDKASSSATVKSTSHLTKDELVATKEKENEEAWQTVDEGETRSKPKINRPKKVKKETKKGGLTKSQRRRLIDEYGGLMDADDRVYQEILAGGYAYGSDDDISDDFDMPELFMGDPRDREVAEIMGMNPYADSFW